MRLAVVGSFAEATQEVRFPSLHELIPVAALREIRHYQKNIGMCIPRRSFMKLVRDLMAKEMDDRRRPDMRITAEALGALQEATEMAMTTMMEMSNHCAIHAKRVTLMHKDVRLIRSLMDIWDPNSWLSNVRKGGIGRAYEKLPM